LFKIQAGNLQFSLFQLGSKVVVATKLGDYLSFGNASSFLSAKQADYSIALGQHNGRQFD
jgi:hypothetical protein